VRIQSSAIQMSSESSLLKSYTKEEALRVWVGDKRPDFEGRGLSAGQLSNAQLDTVELSDQAKAVLTQINSQAKVNKAQKPDTIEISDKDKLKILLLEKLLEHMTGKKIKFRVLDKLEIATDTDNVDSNIVSKNTAPQEQQKQGWGLEYDYHERYQEQEKMSFAAQGIIKTADGKEIDFSVQLNMSRTFMSEKNISVRAGDAVKIDPLVINFNGSAPELTSNKFSFDLDADGKEDQISFVGPGSGFLALDLNGDGQINNGKELFGPSTGDGYTELAQYDKDGNQWIDENDPIYQQLRIWTKDSDGKDQLFALGQKGVSIFLGNIDTPFDMKNQENNLQGQVKKSGIYINENGSVGTIQQVDLAV